MRFLCDPYFGTQKEDRRYGDRLAPGAWEKQWDDALLGQKIAQSIASWTWDVTHDRALSPADLFGGKAPVEALIGLLERIC
jgi:hypothetical protein